MILWVSRKCLRQLLGNLSRANVIMPVPMGWGVPCSQVHCLCGSTGSLWKMVPGTHLLLCLCSSACDLWCLTQWRCSVDTGGVVCREWDQGTCPVVLRIDAMFFYFQNISSRWVIKWLEANLQMWKAGCAQKEKKQNKIITWHLWKYFSIWKG